MICRVHLQHIPIFVRRLHLLSNDIVIASCVRTPFGQPLGKLSAIPATQLSSIVIETAVKQAGMPLESIQHIYMAQESTSMTKDENLTNFLKKSKFSVCEGNTPGIKSFLMGVEALNSQKADAVIVGGLASASKLKDKDVDAPLNNITDSEESYHSHCKDLYFEASENGMYKSELVPVKVTVQTGKSRKILEMIQDELADVRSGSSDGAAALVLTTMTNVFKYQLKPLAAIRGFECLEFNPNDDVPLMLKAIHNLVNKTNITIDAIQHWEIDAELMVLHFLHNHFNIPFNSINPHGNSAILFGSSVTVSLHRMLSHLAHSLQPNKFGCLLTTHAKQSLAILIQKFPLPQSPGPLPRLTLFTKDPCPLCDMLVEELESHFLGEYELEKVYIDRKENVRFLRLYRNDIPVLFLNGQFLSMHRLDVPLLRQKLDMLQL